MPFFPDGQKSLFISGCVKGASIKLVCLLSFYPCVSVCVCVTFEVFTECENCTRPTFTSSGSIEAGEHGLTRGKCFVASRLEVVAVAGLLWISWCV